MLCLQQCRASSCINLSLSVVWRLLSFVEILAQAFFWGVFVSKNIHLLRSSSSFDSPGAGGSGTDLIKGSIDGFFSYRFIETSN